MRISDWSSDVCSSDLHDLDVARLRIHLQLAHMGAVREGGRRRLERAALVEGDRVGARRRHLLEAHRPIGADDREAAPSCFDIGGSRFRSEEHTSEIQSQRRNANAGYGLKKNKKKIRN